MACPPTTSASQPILLVFTATTVAPRQQQPLRHLGPWGRCRAWVLLLLLPPLVLVLVHQAASVVEVLSSLQGGTRRRAARPCGGRCRGWQVPGSGLALVAVAAHQTRAITQITLLCKGRLVDSSQLL